MATIPFIYSGFHDRPLAFVLWYGGAQYLFWREFDDELDDYPRSYDVYRLPEMPDDALRASWTSLPEQAISKIGSVPLKAIVFDPTNRLWIDSSIFEELPLTTNDTGGPHLAV